LLPRPAAGAAAGGRGRRAGGERAQGSGGGEGGEQSAAVQHRRGSFRGSGQDPHYALRAAGAGGIGAGRGREEAAFAPRARRGQVSSATARSLGTSGVSAAARRRSSR